MGRKGDAALSLLKFVLLFAVRGSRLFVSAMVGSIWTLILQLCGGGKLRKCFPDDVETRADELYRLAELSGAVYDDEVTTSIVSELVDGFTLENGWVMQVFDLPINGGRIFLLTNDEHKRHIIASRGTANKANIKADFKYKKVMSETAECFLHRGFKASAEETWETVRPFLDRNYWTSFTGHSLGGAIAVICGMLARTDGFTVSKVVTFGQPKVTNYGGAILWDAEKQLPVTRVVHNTDSVPLLPMAKPSDFWQKGVFFHFGVMIWLDDTGRQEILTSAASNISGRTDYWFQTATFTRIPFTGLFSHPMAGYLKSLWTWVPHYKRVEVVKARKEAEEAEAARKALSEVETPSAGTPTGSGE